MTPEIITFKEPRSLAGMANRPSVAPAGLPFAGPTTKSNHLSTP
jgi:hypothetical protein